MNKSNCVIYYKDENGNLYREDENGKKWYKGSIETVVSPAPDDFIFNQSGVFVKEDCGDEPRIPF